MNIKRIFSDMDGTILNSKGKVSEGNARMICKAGIPITLVSARAPMEMQDAIETLNLTGVQVAFNGGLIYQMENGEVKPIHMEVIKKEITEIILKNVRRYFQKVSLSFYDLTNWYCDIIDEGIRYEHELTGQYATIIENTEIFLQGKINTFKIMMISFDEEIIVKLEKFLRELNLEEVTIQRSGKAYLEITHNLAKKSSGIVYIMQSEKLTKEETAAFGDGHNDLPMLEMVGYPIVMNNALDDIKRIAYRVTKKNDEDGVGYGIEKFLK
ncbi:MAG: Cof-type HAD-IIB family hydrolase [Sarcina sp.]